MGNTQTPRTLATVVLFLLNNGLSINASPVWRYEQTGCSILINGGLAEPQPLILHPGSGSGYAIPDEVGTGSLYLSKGEQLRLVCLGNSLVLDTNETVSDTLVTCVGDTIFRFDDLGIELPFEEIACNSYPTHTAQTTGFACRDGEIAEIGFQVDSEDFQRLITVCHDAANYHTTVAHATIPAVIDACQTSFPRPGFVKGAFYSGISMATIYTRVNQRATLAKIVKSEELALEYMPASGSFYLAKGHLVAKTAFMYGAHQRSTFYYLNTVPMWQKVNAGNWGTMEANIRKYATNMNVDLEVWTGSLGVTRLADIEGVEQEVYLYVDDNGNKAVPAPMLLFKVVYEPTSRKGIVFVTVNNPYQEKLMDELTICNNVCDQISWVSWAPDNSEKGLSYCCEIDEFRNSFLDIPAFETIGVLV